MRELQEIPARLVLSLLDNDPDYLLFNVSVADGSFAGSTRIYAGHEVVSELRSVLNAFPRSVGDNREIVLGAFGPKFAGGAVRLNFRTLDRAGHAVLDAELEDEPNLDVAPRTVAVRMPVDASSIDSFLQELGHVTSKPGATAVLHGVG
jgi:hypothetical protein